MSLNRTKLVGPLFGCLLLLLPASPACTAGRKAKRLDKTRVQEILKRFETPGLEIGTFRLAPDAVVDGDTLRVQGLDTTLRLLAIDTEETFKNAEDRRMLDAGFASYLAQKTKQSRGLVKIATPLGEDGKVFAEQWFQGVSEVRLERDHPKDIRGRYGRYLAYVFAQKNGQWVNYNVECVRAGLSPYFTKYSYSRRFHDEFVAAQQEAQEARRGIWDPSKDHFPDYELRLRWWNARAEFIKQFEADAQGQDNMITLTHWDALLSLEKLEGKPVEILGGIAEITLGDRGPSRVTLSRRLGSDLPLVFFDKDVFANLGISRYRGEFVRARGVVSRYTNKHTKKSQLQIMIELPSQISLPTGLPQEVLGNWPPLDVAPEPAPTEKAKDAEFPGWPGEGN